MTSAISGQSLVAFQRADHILVVDIGSGPGSSSSIAMASGTVPSQVTQGTALKIGFQRSDGHWVVDTFANGTHTPSETTGLIRGGTSPDLALNGSCVFSFAFQGTDGRMYVGTNGQASGGKPTNAFLAGGTSPSVAMNSGCTTSIVFAGTEFPSPHLWFIPSFPLNGSDTTRVMSAGTSPSIAINGPSNRTGIAIRGSNGNLWFGSAANNVNDTGNAIKAGTSPSVAVSSDGSNVFVAYQSSNGGLFLLTQNNLQQNSVRQIGQVIMNNGNSPSIMPTSTGGWQVSYKGPNGNLFIALNPHGNDPDQIEDRQQAMN